MAPPAVQTFGKYQILERVATGGMAEIYRARLEGIGGFQRIFAIKRILPHLSQNADYVAMLVDEAKVAGLLSHANIVQILDLGQVDGVWYIAMEYVDGRDLGATLRRAKERGLTLPVPHTVFVAIELLKGLEYAHQRQVMRGGRAVPLNIIHRDISPPNILLAFQGEVKLTDFGIARASHKALETQSGVIKGRFDYMSPEQAIGSKDLDQRSDLFSAGVVLYEMLTGHHPFRADTELGTLEQIRSGQYTPASARNPDVPFALERIVDRALRVERNERFPSATAFKEALDQFFHDSEFIFTQSTLAAYVRGLFPESNTRAPAKPEGLSLPPVTEVTRGPVAPPRPVEEDRPSDPDDLDLEFEGEGPTRVIDAKGLGPIPALDAGRPPPIDPGAFGLQTSDRDEATLIRESPLGSLAEVTRSGKHGWVDEQETQIRPKAMLDGLDGAPPRPPIAPSSPPSRAAAPRAVWPWALGGVFVGLGLGFLLGSLGGLGVASAVHSLPSSSATVDIVAPPGASILINGAAVGARAAVPTGAPQRLQVSMPGCRTYETEFVLASGESRMIVVALERVGPSVEGVAP